MIYLFWLLCLGFAIEHVDTEESDIPWIARAIFASVFAPVVVGGILYTAPKERS